MGDVYHLVYARDQREAAFRAQNWLAEHSRLPLHTFTACPNGFAIEPIRIPGLWPDELGEVVPLSFPLKYLDAHERGG